MTEFPPADVEVMTLHVIINGTDTNPWHAYGLKCQPFPQLGKMEYRRGEQQIASLDADPIRSASDIRARLAGFAPEFIELCIANFRPGQRVSFMVVFPANREDAQ